MTGCKDTACEDCPFYYQGMCVLGLIAEDET